MENETRNKIERFKDKAEFFLENNIKAFIKDKNDSYYFCDILLVGETHILIFNFTGKRKGEKDRLVWIDVESFEEYKDEGEVENG